MTTSRSAPPHAYPITPAPRALSNLLPITAALAVLLLASPAAAEFGFGAPAPMNHNAATDSAEQYVLDLAFGGDGHLIAFLSSDQLPDGSEGGDNELYIAHSRDNGLTWSPMEPFLPVGEPDEVSHIQANIATDRAGTWIVVWEVFDRFEGTHDVRYSRSTDDGVRWSEPAAFDAAPPEGQGGDGDPEIATDERGNWVVVYGTSRAYDGDEMLDGDLLVVTSSDNGENWSRPALLNSTAIGDGMAGDERGRVATDGAGVWVAIWDSNVFAAPENLNERDMVFARSTDGGQTWTEAALLNTNGATDNGDDLGGALATDGRGTWLAVWTSHDDLEGMIGGSQRPNIYVARSIDNGETWGAPGVVNSTAFDDLPTQIQWMNHAPAIATDGAGTWLVMWESLNVLSETQHRNWDVWVAASQDDGGAWTTAAPLHSSMLVDPGPGSGAKRVRTDGSGRWVVSWGSYDPLGGTTGDDMDALISVSDRLFSATDGVSVR